MTVRSKAVLAIAVLAGVMLPASGSAQSCSWRASWAAAQLPAGANDELSGGGLGDATLRQVVRVSAGGRRVRVRLSNLFGRTPLTIDAASLARSADNRTSRIAPAGLRTLRFGGEAGVTIPAGAEWLSDPVDAPVAAFEDVAVSVHVVGTPDGVTTHPGSRATSYRVAGDAVGATELTGANAVDRWVLLSGLEVERCDRTGGIVVLGDSITDGYGVAANTNARWTDVLARRLGGRAAVINAGIGGNRLLQDGLGPSAMARFDRDVLAQPGVRHLIVLEGVNDLGTLTRERPASPAEHEALVRGITGAYAQIVARARAHGLKVHGATLLPFGGSAYYHPDDRLEADRQAINAWIRAPGHFDDVIDFDRAMRDPKRPDHLDPRYDNDGLHPNIAGYRAMAEAVDLSRFR